MPEVGWLIVAVVAAALIFDFTNGWNDAANAVATVVSTRVLSPTQAVLLSATLNVAGAFAFTAVAKAIGKDIVDPQAITQVVVMAAMLGGICWNVWMTVLGLPISASHALIGGLLGSALAHGGWAIVKGSGLKLILTAMLISPMLGFTLGGLAMWLIKRLVASQPPHRVNEWFKKLQLVSVGFMSFSHGTSDAQKAMGIITLALFSGGYIASIEVPAWVKVSCAIAMGAGTMFGGWKVIKTLGMRMLHLKPVHGFAAETAGAIVLTATAQLGVPVSTTHTITGSLLGVGAATRLSAVRWGVAAKIIWAWVGTMPGAGLVSYGAYLLLARVL